MLSPLSWHQKSRYSFLSLYITWLTQTEAADPELQTAILANGLVNLRGAEDSWFEMDRLSEFFSLHMKKLMSTRRTSTQDITTMFRQTAVTSSYSTTLKELLEVTFIAMHDIRTKILARMFVI